MGEVHALVREHVLGGGFKFRFTDDEGEDANPLNGIAQELQEESDRGMAIVAAVVLEDTVKDILLAWFQNADKIDDCFKSSGPLANFSAKITIAYSLGLISKEEHRELNIIRKIRNDFAHLGEVSFDTQSVSDRAFSMKFAGDAVSVSTPREWFIANALVLLFAMYSRPIEIPKFKGQLGIRKNFRYFEVDGDSAT